MPIERDFGSMCGNVDHPKGGWHAAAPLPASWEYWLRFKQWINKKRWGCRCDKDAGQ